MTSRIVNAMLIAFAALILCSAGYGLVQFAQPVQAETFKTATPEPVKACPEWMTAGAQVIFKCVDEEPPYAVCYVPVAGVMQCIKD